MFRVSWFSCVACLSLSVLLASCEKGRPDLGLDFIEDGDRLGVSEFVSRQFSVSNDTVGYRPVVLFSRASVGQVYDGTFGKSTGHFATELFPSLLEDLAFLPEGGIDSAFLHLHFAEGYGNAPMRVRVYQLRDTISRAEEEVDDAKYAGGPLLGESLLASGKRSVRISLPSDWGQRFVLGAKDVVKDRSKFRTYFPGIYVEGLCEGGEGMGRMLTYHAGDTRSGLSFYWHDGDRKQSLHLVPASASRRYSSLRFDLSGSSVGAAVEKTAEEQAKQSVYYLAGQGRAYAKVDFSALRAQWKDSVPVSLLRAELRIPQVAPSDLYGDSLVYRISSFLKEGDNYIRIPDQAINSSNYHGVYSRTLGYYSLNITMFMQQVLAGAVPGDAMYLFADERSLGYGRVVLGSPLHGERAMSLVLTYTRL